MDHDLSKQCLHCVSTSLESLTVQETVTLPGDHLQSAGSLYGIPIDGSILKAEEQLQTVKHAETALTSLLETIRATRTRCENSLQIMRGSRRFSRGLPDEILAFIFQLSVDTAHHGSRQALVLSGVSRTWRRTALAHPRLWARIRVHFFQRTASPSYLKYLYLMLGRSRNCPLDLYVCLRAEKPQDLPVMQQVLRVLSSRPHLRRWMSVNMDISLQLYERPLFPLGPTPELLSLNFQVVTMNPRPTPHELPPLLTSAPQMRMLSLKNDSQYRIRCDTVPFEQLTNISLILPSLANSSPVQLIKKCPALHTMTLILPVPDIIPDTSSAVVHLFLEHLVVRGESTSFLRLLEAPSLRTLDLDYSTAVIPVAELESLPFFLARSRQLSTLKLNLADDQYPHEFPRELTSPAERLEFHLSHVDEEHLPNLTAFFSAEHIGRVFPGAKVIELSLGENADRQSEDVEHDMSLAFAVVSSLADNRGPNGRLPHLSTFKLVMFFEESASVEREGLEQLSVSNPGWFNVEIIDV